MRYLFAAVVLLGVVCLTPAEEKTVKFETVMQRDGGGPTKATETVIRSEKQWKAFVATVSSESHRAVLAKEKFDFDKEIVVAVARGPSQSVATTEDGISKVRVNGDKAVVAWTVVESDQRESESSHPFHVIKMPKVNDVKFAKTAKTVGG